MRLSFDGKWVFLDHAKGFHYITWCKVSTNRFHWRGFSITPNECSEFSDTPGRVIGHLICLGFIAIGWEISK